MSRIPTKIHNKEVCKIVEAFGGTNNLARLLGLAPAAISQWKVHGIPRAWMAYLLVKKPDIAKIKKG